MLKYMSFKEIARVMCTSRVRPTNPLDRNLRCIIDPMFYKYLSRMNKGNVEYVHQDEDVEIVFFYTNIGISWRAQVKYHDTGRIMYLQFDYNVCIVTADDKFWITTKRLLIDMLNENIDQHNFADQLQYIAYFMYRFACVNKDEVRILVPVLTCIADHGASLCGCCQQI